MKDMIERQAAIDALDKRFDSIPMNQTTEILLLRKDLRELPSAQPKRKRGKWERHYSRPNVYADLFWHCSACGYKSADNWANKYSYCPGCGAEMMGDIDG